MRILLTGGTGVLGRALRPLAEAAGHECRTPIRTELDLFDPLAIADAVDGVQAVAHLATRIPSPDRMGERQAWQANDRLRVDAARFLVDAAIAARVGSTCSRP